MFACSNEGGNTDLNPDTPPTHPSEPSTNTAPVISGTPDTFVTAGNAYLFTPTASDSDNDTLRFSIENEPSWAIFDSLTGEFSGTPGSLDTGITLNIMIQVSDGELSASLSPFSITVLSDNSGTIGSNYITGKSAIPPTLGTTVPQKGEKRIDPVTGAHITRLTDASDYSGTNDSLIVYSRYSPENSAGDKFLVFGSNSMSSWVVERETGNTVAALTYDSNTTHTIGENHEIRWDLSGNHPNWIYFRNGMRLFMIDDVTDQNDTRSVIKDFSSLIPAATRIYNDVEGDSSNDSDHWAFMANHYNGSTYVVDAFVHYQISTDITHILEPSDLAGTGLDHYSANATFPRPNMVEISPLGTGLILHYGRAWGDAGYGSRYRDIGTWFDGPHMWPLDFDFNTVSPVKISVGETHSGWAFDTDGTEMFISQNNRTDMLDAIRVSGVNSGYNNRIEMEEHPGFGGWRLNFHYGKMPLSKKGWAFINTYSQSSETSIWGSNQLIMMQTKPINENPVIWRIAPSYNVFSGNYRDEAPAAINQFGNRIYVSNNWGGRLSNREVFLIELPNNWDSVFSD